MSGIVSSKGVYLWYQTVILAVDALAEEALRKGLEERSWQELLAYGQERGAESMPSK